MTHSQPVEIFLEKGAILEGRGWGDFSKPRGGEFVFSTAMSGIEESLTDPSFAKQIIVSTVAHVGNTGANIEDMESSKIWSEGLVCRRLTEAPSNWRSKLALSEWITNEEKFVVDRIDTRKLTLLLRDQGSQRGLVVPKGDYTSETAQKYLAEHVAPMEKQELASLVSTKTTFQYESQKSQYWPLAEQIAKQGLVVTSKPKIAVWDFGVKQNILRILECMGFDCWVVPASTKAEDLMGMKLHALFLSNGPGDPAAATYVVDELRKVVGRLPIMGICMGHQLLSLALGAKSFKMPFGHRGIHHPVVEFDTDNKPVRTWITSQNHGFAIDEDSLPSNVRVAFRHADDNSVEGIECSEKSCFSVQFHPEAAPGPLDPLTLFRKFLEIQNNAS